MDEITNIIGVVVTPLKSIYTEKGNIFHILKKTDNSYQGFGEVYFSQILFGAIKAWKKHNKMTLNLVVPVGEVKFVIYDDREGSKTHGKIMEVVLSPQKYKRLTIPPDLWFGFKGLSENNLVVNVANIVHDLDEQISILPEKSKIPYNWN